MHKVRYICKMKPVRMVLLPFSENGYNCLMAKPEAELSLIQFQLLILVKYGFRFLSAVHIL